MEKQQMLFENIFKKPLEDSGNQSLLETTATKYPYFAAAQFFLLKLSDDTSANYPLRLQKNAVLFNNNYWLNFQLLPQKKTSFNKELIIEAGKDNLITAQQIDTIQEDQNKEIDAAKTESISNPISVLEPTKDSEDQIDPGELEPSENLVEIPTFKFKLDALNTPVAADAVLFEPLHTTDYFASQGIKLSEQVVPNDKLGKQLKSFTEWLKTMKHIHPEQGSENRFPADTNNSSTEKSIQVLAEKSNQDEVVITESMAEVFIQQGRIKKAIEVYNKLSLLNPVKSAYFAAKINQIKEP